MNTRRRVATSFLTIGLLALFTSSLQADDFAYMLGQTGGHESVWDRGPPVRHVYLDRQYGSGSYAGLGVANGVLYSEQNGSLYSVNVTNAGLTLIGGAVGTNMAAFGSTTSGRYGIAQVGLQSLDKLRDGRRDADWTNRRHSERRKCLCRTFKRFRHALSGKQRQSLHDKHYNRSGHTGRNRNWFLFCVRIALRRRCPLRRLQRFRDWHGQRFYWPDND